MGRDRLGSSELCVGRKDNVSVLDARGVAPVGIFGRLYVGRAARVSKGTSQDDWPVGPDGVPRFASLLRIKR